MKRLNVILKAIDTASIGLGKGCAWVYPPLIAIITYDVIMRRAFSNPSAWAFDVTYILSGFAFVLIMAWTLQSGGHVAIDIVSVGLKPRVRSIMHSVLIPIMCLPVLVIIEWKGTGAAINATRIGEAATSPALIPIWELRWALVVGFGFLTLQMIAEWIRDIIYSVKGKPIEELISERGAE